MTGRSKINKKLREWSCNGKAHLMHSFFNLGSEHSYLEDIFS